MHSKAPFYMQNTIIDDKLVTRYTVELGYTGFGYCGEIRCIANVFCVIRMDTTWHIESELTEFYCNSAKEDLEAKSGLRY